MAVAHTLARRPAPSWASFSASFLNRIAPRSRRYYDALSTDCLRTNEPSLSCLISFTLGTPERLDAVWVFVYLD